MATEPWSDPIVEEVRAAREALLREAGGDVGELCRRLMERQEQRGNELVSFETVGLQELKRRIREAYPGAVSEGD